MTTFVDTLLQPISKSQKSYLSLNRQMWRTEHFLFRWTLWVLIQIYRKTRVFKLPVKHIKFMQRQLIPTHYSPEMLWLIVEENSFHFNEKHYLQTHGTAVGTKTTVSFANIFMAYIETTTLSRTVFKPTVWKCYINDISPYGTYVNQKKQTYITRLLNSRLKHLTLRLCF